MASAANALSRKGVCIVAHTLTEAAAAVGKNRTTILRAIKSGKISAARDPVSGDWQIEAAELFRLYRPVAHAPSTSAHAMAEPANAPANALSRHDDLSAENRDLRTQLAAAEARLADAHDQIIDLRQQRDREAEERRRLTALIADQRATPPAPEPNVTRRSWWRWGRG